MEFSPKKFKELRESKGLTQIQVDKMANYKSTSTHKIETGRMKPSMDKLIAICMAFGCSLEDFME